MLKPRILMFGTMPVGESPDELKDLPEFSPEKGQDDEFEGIFDCIVVVPVIARPSVQSDRAGWVDNTAEVVVGDVTDAMSLSPFERTQAEYEGLDNRGTPVIGYDEVSSDMFQNG